jgi:hypothetical protein
LKPSPFEHLARRSLFVEDVRKELPAHTPSVRKELPAHTPEPPVVTVDSPRPVKIAAAVAALVEIGAPPVEPPPLIDTTQRGRGRPKQSEANALAALARRRAWNRERMAARRASQ